jgi:hypothetical protein
MRPLACNPVALLEEDERLAGLRAEDAVGLADVETFLLQHDLHVADLVTAQIDLGLISTLGTAPSAAVHLRR